MVYLWYNISVNILLYILLCTLVHLHFNHVHITSYCTCLCQFTNSYRKQTKMHSVWCTEHTVEQNLKYDRIQTRDISILACGTEGSRRGVILIITTRWRQITMSSVQQHTDLNKPNFFFIYEHLFKTCYAVIHYSFYFEWTTFFERAKSGTKEATGQ